mgnify:FL=1
MLTNYFTLLSISRFLQNSLLSKGIQEIYSQEKEQLNITFEGETVSTLCISCLPSDQYVYLREAAFRARKNSVDVFPALHGQKVEQIYCDVGDRIMYLSFRSGIFLCVDMFGNKANVVLCNADGEVRDAFLHKKGLLGTKRHLQTEYKEFVLHDFFKTDSDCVEFFRTCNNKNVVQALKAFYPKLGTMLADEIVLQSGLSLQQLATACTAEDIARLQEETRRLVAMLVTHNTLQPRIYFDEQTPLSFSLVPLRQYAAFREEIFPDVSAAIQRFVGRTRASSSFQQQKKELSAWLKKEIEKTHRTLSHVEEDIHHAERAENYELFGSLLMTHLYSIEKGMKEVNVENVLVPDSPTVTIPLESALTPQQNAERYFEKGKKARTAIVDGQQRKKWLTQREHLLSELSTSIEEITTHAELQKYIATHAQQLKHIGYMSEKEQAELPPFKIFTVEGGFQVLAGKSSDNNDLLTMKYAKPNDLWFHARGSSGSHVVLKTGSASGVPTKKAVHQAASIAAYYSKMKNSSHVPVAMTEKKYVRKPKGAPSGTVVLEKEKVIFVAPMLPENKEKQ